MYLKGINVLRNILIGLSLMSVVANVSADHGIGFVVGSTYGYGLGYNRYLDNGYGWQISGFPYVEEDYRNLNLGLTVFKTLHEGKSGRPFLFLGAVIHHKYEKDEWEEILYLADKLTPPVPRQQIYVLAFGPGIGLEWKFFQNFAFSIGVPTAIFLDFEGGQNGFKFAIRPYLNVALMYRW